MPTCSYCGEEYPKHKGLTVVNSKSGEMKHYCGSKCRKNANMSKKKKEWAKKSSQQG
jgi:ribosomal protein L24E